jgi:hypothetical protein
MRAAAVTLLLFAACATSKPKLAAPEWSEVPPNVLEVLCSRFHSEGISRDQVLNVVATTRPLVTATSMQALSAAAFFHGRLDPDAPAQAMREGSRTIPIRATAGDCSWRTIPASGVALQTDVMTVELSAPLVNPFVRNSVGMLARLSLGGDAPFWYWIPIGERAGGWAAGPPMTLTTRE